MNLDYQDEVSQCPILFILLILFILSKKLHASNTHRDYTTAKQKDPPDDPGRHIRRIPAWVSG